MNTITISYLKNHYYWGENNYIHTFQIGNLASFKEHHFPLQLRPKLLKLFLYVPFPHANISSVTLKVVPMEDHCVCAIT